MNRAEAAKLIEQKLSEISVYINVDPFSLLEDKFIKVWEGTVAPLNLWPVFRRIGLVAKAGWGIEDNIAVILLEYSWEHPSGRNGFDVRLTYRNGEWEAA